MIRRNGSGTSAPSATAPVFLQYTSLSSQ
jgi:hypothetical protein